MDRAKSYTLHELGNITLLGRDAVNIYYTLIAL